MLQTALKLGSLRSLKVREGLIDLTSNDYLGLARDPLFQKMAMQRWDEWSLRLNQKVGSTGSRLLTGNHCYFEEVENAIARFHGFPTATLLNCGYMANLAVLSAFCKPHDVLIADLHIHASMHDAMQLSKAQKHFFRHNDLNHLETRLKRTQGKCYVLIESLYSMGGDFSPLAQIASLCEHYGAHLIVDEAHSLGVLGPQGAGLVAALGLQERVFACMGTFGKALGAHGAVLLGSSLFQKMLINFARPLIYTTALPLSTLAAISCSYERLPQLERERRHLAQLCRHFGFTSHIYPILMPGSARAKCASLFLASKDFDVRAIFSPSVPRTQERLRFIAHAFNTYRDIERCLQWIHLWRNP